MSGNYNFHAVCDKSSKVPSDITVGIGGVAILWHIKYHDSVVLLSTDSECIARIKLELSPGLYIFIFR